ncbi:MAG: sulfotransferase family 2 domain-containing protein, partial [Hyphomicrobiales bacterium]
PKAAGTSIEETFVNAGYKMTFRRGGVYGPLNEFDKKNRCSPQHLHADLLEKHFGDSHFDLCFTVVRHPIERLISEFKFRTNGDHPFMQDKSLDEFALSAIKQYPKTPSMLDNHIRPQEQFLWRDCDVIRLEEGLSKVAQLVFHINGDKLDFSTKPKMKSKLQTNLNLSPEAEKNVRRFYKSDFLRFDYG